MAFDPLRYQNVFIYEQKYIMYHKVKCLSIRKKRMNAGVIVHTCAYMNFG